MKRYLTTLALGLLLAAPALAQPGWNWPADSAKQVIAREKYVLHSDAIKEDEYQRAKAPFLWLLQNTPTLNEALYINGAKIYEALTEMEEDEARALELADTVMLMYDLRIKHFNDRANVMNRKAYAAYKYLKSDRSRYGYIFDVMKEAIELNGKNVFDANLVYFMVVMSNHYRLNKAISDIEVLDYYTMIQNVLDEKIAQGKNVERLEGFKTKIDNILTKTVEVDCEFVEANLVPRLKDNPDDLEMAKKIVSFMLRGECTSSPNFLLAAERVYSQEPSYGFAKVIGLKYKGEGDCEKAIDYLEDALERTEDPAKQGEIHMEIAECYVAMGKRSSARTSALNATSADPTLKEAYNLIGNLYFNSFDVCKGGQSIVKDRAVFMAAYEMYARAGNADGMAKAKAQFPSVEEAFNEGKAKGDLISVGCWIGGSVKLDTRN